MSTKIKWFKGPPPSIGWWPASSICSTLTFRWWNGEYWSRPAYPTDTALQAAMEAGIPSMLDTKRIKWTHRPDSWPARSKT